VDGIDGEVLECAAILHDALLWAGWNARDS
jgi:hypothetical protein